VGIQLAERFTLPADFVNLSTVNEEMAVHFRDLSIFAEAGWLWIFSNNIRAIALATLLGTFTFGVLSEILLMAPIGIVGYFAGSIAFNGGNSLLFMVALVLPHAILEIPAAIIAGAAILQLGMAALSVPKGRSLSESWIKALAEWARLGIGLVLPLLFGAALIEAYITPRIALWLLFG
jgi:uncharacterized membrane protein SpoIIM required for sporulation